MGMKPGARLAVLTTDPLAGLDIPAFAAEAGHRLISAERLANGHRFVIERGENG
jgi:tRNA 2-thiouridine synthesizing protein A